VSFLSKPPYLTLFRAQRTFREESPTLSAQMRRVSRIARPPIPRPRASQHNAQILTVQTKSPSLSETPDLDAPYRQSQVATTKNAWRIHSRYEPRQTRSQRKKTNIRACPAATQQPKRKIVVLKVGQGTQRDPPLASFHSRPASRLVQLSYSNKPSQAGLTTQSPTRRPIKTASKTSGTKIRRQNPKRRQRREIAQLEDLDTFMAACPP
jgi:hypothetical protein